MSQAAANRWTVAKWCNKHRLMLRLRGNRKGARLSVGLDDRDYAELCALTRRGDVLVAWVVRQAIRSLIQHEQDKTRKPELLLRSAGRCRQAAT